MVKLNFDEHILYKSQNISYNYNMQLWYFTALWNNEILEFTLLNIWNWYAKLGLYQHHKTKKNNLSKSYMRIQVIIG